MKMRKTLITGVALLWASWAFGNSSFDNTDFSKADSIAAHYQGYDIANLMLLSHHLTTNLDTDVEKFRAIYRWVCDNIRYDYGFFALNKTKRSKYQGQPQKLSTWNQEFSKRVFERLRKHKRTVCTGYAYLVRELASYAGLDCHIVDGYGRSSVANVEGEGIPNHSWNAVKLEGNWYLCDPTWSAGFTTAQGVFTKSFKESYFLTKPELFALNHYPLEIKWLLINGELSLEQFMTAPLVYEYGLRKKIKPLAPTSFNNQVKRGEPFEIKFVKVDKGHPGEISLTVVKNSSTRQVKAALETTGMGYYQTEYSFNHKGSYVLHLYQAENPVITYKVMVY